MAKTFWFNAKIGHSKHTGLNSLEPKRDADDFNRLLLEPGDRVRFHAGDTFEGNFDLSRSGAEGQRIVIDTYMMGGESTRWANFNADPTATHPIAWNVNASHVVLDHLQSTGARFAGFVFRRQQAHMDADNLRTRRCGIGMRLEGSHITVRHADVQDPTMSRYERKATDEGGVAFSIESNGWLNEGNTILNPFVQGAIAAGDEKRDGGDIEIFGDVVGLVVDGGIFLYADGGVEVGGPSRAPGETPALTRDVTIKNSLFYNTGILGQLNHPEGAFPIRVKNLTFKNNTIYDRTRDRSAVWIQGDWPEIDEALRFDGNIYDGIGTWIGTSGETDLNSIPRSGNVYHRVGGTELGYKAKPDERVMDPGFFNPAGLDFRLLKVIPGLTSRPGAFEVGLSYNSLVDLGWLLKKNRIPFTANDIKGGLHSHPYHRHMWSIPKELRKAGMECAVSVFDQRWRLDEDLTTWMQGGAYD